MNKFKTKILSIAIGFCLLETASYASSKRPVVEPPFTVAFDCETDTVSWTGAPSNTGSIALFASSKIRTPTQAIANIPATRSMVTGDDSLTFYSQDRVIDSTGQICSPMFTYRKLISSPLKHCPGDLEITAFAIQDPILMVKKEEYIDSHTYTSPTTVRDLAKSKALASASITVQCPQK